MRSLEKTRKGRRQKRAQVERGNRARDSTTTSSTNASARGEEEAMKRTDKTKYVLEGMKVLLRARRRLCRTIALRFQDSRHLVRHRDADNRPMKSLQMV